MQDFTLLFQTWTFFLFWHPGSPTQYGKVQQAIGVTPAKEIRKNACLSARGKVVSQDSWPMIPTGVWWKQKRKIPFVRTLTTGLTIVSKSLLLTILQSFSSKGLMSGYDGYSHTWKCYCHWILLSYNRRNSCCAPVLPSLAAKCFEKNWRLALPACMGLCREMAKAELALTLCQLFLTGCCASLLAGRLLFRTYTFRE